MAPYSADPTLTASLLPVGDLFLPGTEPSGQSAPALQRQRSREGSRSNGKAARKKRLQLFLSQIKCLVKQGQHAGKERPRRLGTLEAMDRALEMLRHQSMPMPLSAENVASSPANSSSSTSTSSVPSPAAPGHGHLPHSPPVELKACGSPQSGSAAADFQPALQWPQGRPMLGRRLLGSLFVSLPEGLVLECRDSEGAGQGDLALSGIARPGDSLLALLHGKGAQTLLLNAFCGHPRRRMYARVKWGLQQMVRACELLCEFSVDSQSMARRLAHIQVYCLQSGPVLFGSAEETENNDGHGEQKEQQQQLGTFTTRHNSTGALIYLDSNSIPLLGHFPSEVTGKSLFSLVHPEDGPKVRETHQQLHSSRGTQIVRTPGLRLLAYSGQPVLVDSEWAAFVNPWTRHIEMVVGRHFFSPSAQQQQLIREDQAQQLIREDQAQQLIREDQAQQLIREDQQAMAAPELGERDQNRFVCAEQLAEPIQENEANQASSDQLKHSNDQQQLLNDQQNNDVKQEEELEQFTSVQRQQVLLSYNQINCLENVHRLLKSQNQPKGEADEELAKCQKALAENGQEEKRGMPSLTQELLQKHDQRWEEECRDHWRRRLSAGTGLKRSASGGQFDHIHAPPSKQFRRGSEGGMPKSLSAENSSPCPASSAPFFLASEPAMGKAFPLLQNQPECQHLMPFDTFRLLRQLTSANSGNLMPSAAVHQQPELLDQLLQAANTARNTLALRLMQDQQQQMGECQFS